MNFFDCSSDYISDITLHFYGFILQLVSWLFPLFSCSSLHTGLMAVFPLSFTPVISCWVCALSDKTGRTALFSSCISRHVSHCVYGNVFHSLLLLLASQGGRMHILPAYLPVLVHLKMRVSVQTVSESVMDREELTTLHITQVSVVQANMSRIPCYGSHRQADPPDRKTNMAALGWVEGRDSLKGVYL